MNTANKQNNVQSNNNAVLHDHEFSQFRDLIFRIAGISMSPAKKQLVSSRLAKRLRHHNLANYGEYYRLITSVHGKNELQMAVDALTTNETHFFREPKHFDFLKQKIIPGRKAGRGIRIWSAACSSGEEPYSIAMMLDEAMGSEPWEVVATDISSQILEKARNGLYPADRIPEVPKHYLSRYCLKGIGEYHGTMRIDKPLRDKVRFMQHNLIEVPGKLGEFDAIFLRNVMIYFDQETKRQVVSHLTPLLRPGGYFIIGHSESLNGVNAELRPVSPAVYQKPD